MNELDDTLTTFPLKGGGEWVCTIGYFRTLRKAYGDVRRPSWVRAELMKMKAWLEANPARRKKNMERFIVNWLNRRVAEQGQLPKRIRRGNPVDIGSLLA